MMQAVTDALAVVITWIGSVVTSLTATSGGLSPLLPLFAIGIAVSGFRMAMGSIRRVTWGA